MPEPMIRGHVIMHTAAFFRTQCDRVTSQHFDGEVPLELSSQLEKLTAAGWYPRRYHTDLLNTLVRMKGSNDNTYADLLRCGAAMTASENEFTKLLMKVLTPELFIKKLPKFWARDYRSSGSLEVELDAANRVSQVRMRDVGGYDHGAIVWLGWMKRVLEIVAGPRAEVRQSGWSWSNPAPHDVAYEVKWS